MRRKRSDRREQYIKQVVEAWDKIPSRDKPDLMIKHSELYYALAWLSAHEAVTEEMKNR